MTGSPQSWLCCSLPNAQHNLQYGPFKVTDRIYQVRGYDLSNNTLVQCDTGWFNIVTP